METCAKCNAEIAKGSLHCPACGAMTKAGALRAWRRMQAVYISMMIVGVLILAFTLPPLHNVQGSPPPGPFFLGIFGGLLTLGGLFGLTISLLLQWMRKR